MERNEKRKKKMRIIFGESDNQKSFRAALAVGLTLTFLAILFLPL